MKTRDGGARGIIGIRAHLRRFDKFWVTNTVRNCECEVPAAHSCRASQYHDDVVYTNTYYITASDKTPPLSGSGYSGYARVWCRVW